ncbi:unnamed protein product [Brassica rapa subsp. narinosa]
MANSFVFLTDLNLASVLSPLRCDFSGSERHRRESSVVTNRRSWTSWYWIVFNEINMKALSRINIWSLKHNGIQVTHQV